MDNRNLISSSKALSNISKTFGDFTISLNAFATTTTKIAKTINEGNALKRKTIADEQSFFAKRRTAFLRKRKEDQVEATGIKGAAKAKSSIIKNPARGFLGRILDFFAVTLLSWVTFQLPKILTRFQGLIKNIGKLVGVFDNFINTIAGSLVDYNQNLEQVGQTVSEQQLDAEEFTKKFNADGTKAEMGFFKMGRDFQDVIAKYTDPATYGFKGKEFPSNEKVNPIELLENRSPGGPTGTTNNGSGPTGPTGITTNTNGPSGPTGIGTNTDGPSGPTGGDVIIFGAEDYDLFDEKIANDKTQPLLKRFEAGYTPKKEIFFKDEKGNQRSKINPEWVEYQEWLNKVDLEINGWAEGGRIDARQLGLVGEEGPELFISDKPGTIIPHDVSVDFIEKIIANKNNASIIDQKRAARSLYEKLVENHIAKHGHIRTDEDDRIKSETIGRLKQSLSNTSSLETKKTIESQKSLEIDQVIEIDKNNSILSKIDLPKINIPDLKTQKRGPVIVMPPLSSSVQKQSPSIIPMGTSKSRSFSIPSNTEKVMYKHLSTLVTAYT